MSQNAESKAHLLLVGTEHFVSRQDVYKPPVRDMLSPQNQQDIEDVVAGLARFRPTKLAVEAEPEQIEQLNDEYRAYVDGSFTLHADEVHQVAFRVARRNGLDTLHGIDAWGRFYDGADDEGLDAYAKEHGQEQILPAWEKRIQAHFASEDDGTWNRPLRDRLLHLNSDAWVLASHGAYMGLLRIGDAADPRGADFVTGWWYNRNLRIFANIQAISEEPGTRLLVLIGAGHIPILRHCAAASWDHELEDVGTYLGGDASDAP